MHPYLPYLADVRQAFVAHLADRLSDAICTETQAHADHVGVRAPARTHSAILYLHRRGPATLSEIARTDGQSHQMLAARLAPLERLGLIERFDDPTDRRRRPYRLTKAGRADAKLVERVVVREPADPTSAALCRCPVAPGAPGAGGRLVAQPGRFRGAAQPT